MDQVWSEDIQREAQKDLIKAYQRGQDSVDSFFAKNNPWHLERSGTEKISRQYNDLRESGLTADEALAQLKPQINQNFYDRAKQQGYAFPGTWERASAGPELDYAYDPQKYGNVWESKYADYTNKIKAPLNIDFTNRMYIPGVAQEAINAEANRQAEKYYYGVGLDASQIGDNLNVYQARQLAKISGLEGDPAKQQATAEKFGYSNFNELAGAHYDFKSYSASLPKFSDTDRNVYTGDDGSKYVFNAKAA